MCQECTKFDMLEMVEERGSDIFCCKMGTLCAKNILQDVMFVTEGKGVEVRMFLSVVRRRRCSWSAAPCSS